MKIALLGGGISSLSLAYFIQSSDRYKEIIIIEKEDKLGGLMRSFNKEGIYYDIGPHIMFSKNKDILNLMKDMLGKNISEIRRSNQIIYKNKFVQYPFENDLSKLPKDDLEYCLDFFLKNQHEKIKPENMHQFFLKNFGEGITNTYLKPYNEKIWKYDISQMDLQMVERIPKPPKDDIIKSSKGITVDGYLHQLYFSYPSKGGINSLVYEFLKKLSTKSKIYNNSEIKEIKKENNSFFIKTSKNKFEVDKIVSSIPLEELGNIYINSSNDIKKKSKNLEYNSIIISIVNVEGDWAGNNFAFMIPDKNIIFHRISKLDFLGKNYSIPGTTTFEIEITYKKNDLIDKKNNNELINEISNDLIKIGFLDHIKKINFFEIKKFTHAYVIYNLQHRTTVDFLKNYYNSEGVFLNGRFGMYEYMNSDKVIEESLKLSKELV